MAWADLGWEGFGSKSQYNSHSELGYSFSFNLKCQSLSKPSFPKILFLYIMYRLIAFLFCVVLGDSMLLQLSKIVLLWVSNWIVYLAKNSKSNHSNIFYSQLTNWKSNKGINNEYGATRPNRQRLTYSTNCNSISIDFRSSFC